MEQAVERQLAQYAFVREERDREVRLSFREASAPHIALAFREAGAALISITGERIVPVAAGGPPEDTEQTGKDLAENGGEQRPRHTRKAGRRGTQPVPPQGEVLLRYFFALRETVYTVSISLASGVSGSVAGIYPSARLLEHGLRDRLGMVFTNAEC